MNTGIGGFLEDSIIDLIIALKGKCSITDENIRGKTTLSPSEYRALMSISEVEVLSSTEFSGRIGLSPSRGSRVIEKMIQNGYLSRKSYPGDRRTAIISLSPEAVELKKRIVEIKRECEQKIKAKVPAKELDTIKRALNKLISIL